jgi:hypothetical protein
MPEGVEAFTTADEPHAAVALRGDPAPGHAADLGPQVVARSAFDVRLVGVLLKRRELFTHEWLPRWVVLSGRVLSYCRPAPGAGNGFHDEVIPVVAASRTPTEVVVTGTIPGQWKAEASALTDASSLQFTVTAVVTGGRKAKSYSVRALSPLDFHVWLTTLHAVISNCRDNDAP